MRRTVPPSAELEKRIDEVLASGIAADEPEGPLSELARLGAKLIIQRAVEEEFDAWLGRARYERRPEAPPGKRNGFRPRRLKAAEGELEVEVPQVREAAEPFTSKLFPRGKRLLRTEPLRAMVVGAFVRGLSMRDVESLCEEAGRGQISKSTASRICKELRDRFRAFQARDLSGIRLVALFLDAIYLPVRPSGAKEGVLCAWGITAGGERVLLSVSLGDARGRGGLDRARARPDRPRAWGAAARRLRRRARAHQRRRAALASGRPPAMHGPPAQERAREAA